MPGIYTRQQMAAVIDHAVLKPIQTDKDILDNCKMCDENGVFSLCVRPSDVRLAAYTLRNSKTKVSMVVGFPHGANAPATKAAEARQGILDGAVELDMVWNIGKFLSGDANWARRDIEAVVAEARKFKDVKVKVILETCWLNDEQLVQACRIAQAAGADFVKTSTGFGEGPATPHAIDLMIKTVGKTMGVKASAGIRTYEVAAGYLDQGCTRLGVASTIAVLDGADAIAKGGKGAGEAAKGGSY